MSLHLLQDDHSAPNLRFSPPNGRRWSCGKDSSPPRLFGDVNPIAETALSAQANALQVSAPVCLGGILECDTWLIEILPLPASFFSSPEKEAESAVEQKPQLHKSFNNFKGNLQLWVFRETIFHSYVPGWLYQLPNNFTTTPVESA